MDRAMTLARTTPRAWRYGILVAALVAGGCAFDSASEPPPDSRTPREIIDLGTLVTEDLPERIWGKAYLAANGFEEPNTFDVIRWTFDSGDGVLSGSNAYYRLFNHGGPHVDAPNHIGLEGGLDSYAVDAFTGPVKAFDVSDYATGRSVPIDAFTEQEITAGDIVLIYTGYVPPSTDDAIPDTITLTPDAAEYLASIPVRAYGTDSWSVANLDAEPVDGATKEARAVPIHNAFLSRGIPVYEQLFNVDALLGKDDLWFVGVPLNIENADGMIVRPVVLAY